MPETHRRTSTAKYDLHMSTRGTYQGHATDTADLDAASQFKPYYHGERIRVTRDYGDGETHTRTGTVGMTTGWRPAFLLMARSNSMGSSDVLGPEDKIVAVRDRTGTYREIAS